MQKDSSQKMRLTDDAEPHGLLIARGLFSTTRGLFSTKWVDEKLGQYPAGSPVKTLGKALAKTLTITMVRQLRFPRMLTGLVEAIILAIVFILAGIVSLGIPVSMMLGPMVPVVCLMMLCMVASGVYREEINHSIINLYIHSAYGFCMAAVGFLIVTLFFLPPEFAKPKFYFFFLFFAFFVSNTIRPLISGTDFMDGGGRRGN